MLSGTRIDIFRFSPKRNEMTFSHQDITVSRRNMYQCRTIRFVTHAWEIKCIFTLHIITTPEILWGDLVFVMQSTTFHP
jgi:hypothetical protein